MKAKRIVSTKIAKEPIAVIKRMLLMMESAFDREFESHKPPPQQMIARNKEQRKTMASCRHGLFFGARVRCGAVIARYRREMRELALR
jgi:hypothetical protein